jgi:hypothetical protein
MFYSYKSKIIWPVRSSCVLPTVGSTTQDLIGTTRELLGTSGRSECHVSKFPWLYPCWPGNLMEAVDWIKLSSSIISLLHLSVKDLKYGCRRGKTTVMIFWYFSDYALAHICFQSPRMHLLRFVSQKGEPSAGFS